jgi:hypothetical protein
MRHNVIGRNASPLKSPTCATRVSLEISHRCLLFSPVHIGGRFSSCLDSAETLLPCYFGIDHWHLLKTHDRMDAGRPIWGSIAFGSWCGMLVWILWWLVEAMVVRLLLQMVAASWIFGCFASGMSCGGQLSRIYRNFSHLLPRSFDMPFSRSGVSFH